MVKFSKLLTPSKLIASLSDLLEFAYVLHSPSLRNRRHAVSYKHRPIKIRATGFNF
jgi:hypothetical protein